MVFARPRRATSSYDLWVGDEAWDVDYFLHENPELKRAPYAWLTDFVGWLPMPTAATARRALTADYNAEMIEQIARYPAPAGPRRSSSAIRPTSCPDSFGDGLPLIRDWVEQHFEFSGYVTGLRSGGARRPRRRCAPSLGYRPDEKVCVVTVGGSGVGRRSAAPGDPAAFPAAKRAGARTCG